MLSYVVEGFGIQLIESWLILIILVNSSQNLNGNRLKSFLIKVRNNIPKHYKISMLNGNKCIDDQK